MNTEGSPDIPAVATGLFPEACAVSGISQWQVLRQQPLICVVYGDGLLRSGDEVFVCLTVNNLVQLLVELLQLGSLGHLIFEQEKRRLQRHKALAAEELETKVDDGLVQEHTPLPEEVTPVSNRLDTPIRVVTVEPGEHLVVAEALALLHRQPFWAVRSDDLVVVLVVADRDGVVDDVADCGKLLVEDLLLLSCRVDELLLGLFESNLLLEELAGVFLCLLLGSNLFLDIVDLRVHLRGSVLRCIRGKRGGY